MPQERHSSLGAVRGRSSALGGCLRDLLRLCLSVVQQPLGATMVGPERPQGQDTDMGTDVLRAMATCQWCVMSWPAARSVDRTRDSSV